MLPRLASLVLVASALALVGPASHARACQDAGYDGPDGSGSSPPHYDPFDAGPGCHLEDGGYLCGEGPPVVVCESQDADVPRDAGVPRDAEVPRDGAAPRDASCTDLVTDGDVWRRSECASDADCTRLPGTLCGADGYCTCSPPPATPSGGAGGCSVGDARAASATTPWAWALVTVALGLVLRRRRASAPVVSSAQRG